ncbi:hypothetical protein VTK56DRAFT_966 [Thermocarpiscus australiensis]
MAQPPELSPSRLQSSLDSTSVKPCVQQDLEIEQRQPHRRPEKHQETLQSRQLNQTAQTSDAPTIESHTRSTDAPGGHSTVVDDNKVASNGVSGVNDSLNNHASVASSAEIKRDINDTQSKPQYGGAPPLSTLPEMPDPQPPHGPPPQPVTYAGSVSYTPAGIPPLPHSGYVYLPGAATSADPYRPAPTALPSMRTLDPRQPQAQSQHGLALGTHLAAQITQTPAPVPMAYYGVHPHAHMYGLPDPNLMRIPLAPGLPDPRIALSGGRHKKEIKRRTKTGCLTCRKRRIKCDEAHPTCNNCKKSKRECLGYDPIFRQQHGPAVIQPAPSSRPPAPTPGTAAAAPAPTLSSSAAHPYQSSYPPSLPSSVAFDSPVSTTPQVKTESGVTLDSAVSTTPQVKREPSSDYSPAIDPALQGAIAPSAPGTGAAQPPQNSQAPGADPGGGDPKQLRGGTPSSPSTMSALSQPQSRKITSAHTTLPAKKMKVDELIDLGGAAPPPPSSPPSAEVLDEITKLYYEVYVPGLTSFFETRWYDFTKIPATTDNPAAALHNDQRLVSLFATFLQSISKIKSADHVDMVNCGHLETRVVWSLARLPLSNTPTQRQQIQQVPVEDDPWEACGRLQVFEALMSGETLPSNPLSPPPPPSSNVGPLRRHELEFWFHLAKYLLQAHASASPPDTSIRESCLSVMRSLLNGRENRDVLYSIAVLREYTAHWDALYNEQTAPSHLEESDARNKLAVATRFIRNESASTGGTTNVVRRFADLACRAFIRPGVNVNKTMS